MERDKNTHSEILKYACDINSNRRPNTDFERELIQDNINYFRNELNIYFRIKYGKTLSEWFELFTSGNPWTTINNDQNDIMEYINSLNLLNQLEYLIFINKGI